MSQKKANEQTLSELHSVVANYLINAIKNDEATSSDVNNAIKFLKDNDITCIIDETNELGDLKQALNKRSKNDMPMKMNELTEEELKEIEQTASRLVN